MTTDPATAVPEVSPPSAGDFVAFTQRVRTDLVVIAAAVLLDRGDAEDVVQDALAAAFTDWDRIGTLDRPDLWVRRVTVNRAIDLRRRHHRFTAVFGRLTGEATLRAGLGDTVSFWDGVGRLSRRQQEVVVLRATGDLSMEEIALALDIAPGTVKATLHAARTKLAHLVEGGER